MKSPKIFKQPKKMIKYINIIYIFLLLIFIGNIIIGLVNGTRKIDCLWTSGIVILIILNSWILTVRPFYEKIEEKNIEKIKNI